MSAPDAAASIAIGWQIGPGRVPEMGGLDWSVDAERLDGSGAKAAEFHQSGWCATGWGARRKVRRARRRARREVGA